MSLMSALSVVINTYRLNNGKTGTLDKIYHIYKKLLPKADMTELV